MYNHGLPLLFLILLSLPVGAQDASHAGSEFHRYHFSLIAGFNDAREEKTGLIGVDAAVRIHRLLSAGFTFEHVGHSLREAVYVGSAIVHPWKHLWFGAGPGWEARPEEAAEGEPGGLERRNVTRKLFRVGGGYHFHLSKTVSFGPDLAVDFLKGERVYVFGVSLGLGVHEVHGH